MFIALLLLGKIIKFAATLKVESSKPIDPEAIKSAESPIADVPENPIITVTAGPSGPIVTETVIVNPPPVIVTETKTECILTVVNTVVSTTECLISGSDLSTVTSIVSVTVTKPGATVTESVIVTQPLVSTSTVYVSSNFPVVTVTQSSTILVDPPVVTSTIYVSKTQCVVTVTQTKVTTTQCEPTITTTTTTITITKSDTSTSSPSIVTTRITITVTKSDEPGKKMLNNSGISSESAQNSASISVKSSDNSIDSPHKFNCVSDPASERICCNALQEDSF